MPTHPAPSVSRQNLCSSNEVAAVLYVHALDCWPQDVDVPCDPKAAINTYFGSHAPGEWFEVTKRVSWFGFINAAKTVRWSQPSDACMA